jgi:predicted DNA-binding transcriptional regulator AlpA
MTNLSRKKAASWVRRFLLKNKDLRIQDVADKIGIHYATLWRIGTYRAFPTQETADKISAYRESLLSGGHRVYRKKAERVSEAVTTNEARMAEAIDVLSSLIYRMYILTSELKEAVITTSSAERPGQPQPQLQYPPSQDLPGTQGS